MPRESYQRRLDELRAAVAEMGALVVDRLETALTALETGDERLAREVIDGDDEINTMYLDLEGDCIDLFALQQPVAGDLRFLTSTFKILTDLERVGDLATNLGEYALSSTSDRTPEIGVVDIGRDAVSLVERSVEAYTSGDVEAARAIAAADDDLDALCQSASQQLVRELVERDSGADPWDVEQLLDDISVLLLTVRDVERVGDHGVNIAARTLYMVENDTELLY
jgi:phosphate transport system protein